MSTTLYFIARTESEISAALDELPDEFEAGYEPVTPRQLGLVLASLNRALAALDEVKSRV